MLRLLSSHACRWFTRRKAGMEGAAQLFSWTGGLQGHAFFLMVVQHSLPASPIGRHAEHLFWCLFSQGHTGHQVSLDLY